VHTSGAAGVGVEGAFEDGAEDGGGDVAPVEIVAGFGKEEFLDGLVELGYLDVFLGEETAVDVGEVEEDGLFVRAAFFFGGVEDAEKIDQGIAKVGRLEGGEIIVELALASEDSGVLGVEAEDESDAELVETFEGGFGGGIEIVLENLIVKASDDLPGLKGKFHFAFDAVPAGVDQKVKTGILFREVLEENFDGVAGRIFHIVNQEGCEIAGDDPAWTFGIGELGGIAFGLLERGQERTVGLEDGFAEVFVNPLLFDKDVGGRDVGVDETGMVEMDLVFEVDEIFGFGDAEDGTEERHPERLAFPFLIAAAFPVFDETADRLSLFR